MNETPTQLLFSYGTLQLKQVQVETYGRLLEGEEDSLPGYELRNLTITDPDVLQKSGVGVHPIACKTDNIDDLVKGMIFKITEEELEETDKYEVSNYCRVLETFASGRQAWVYVAKVSS